MKSANSKTNIHIMRLHENMRLGIDRRDFSYSVHVPERRTLKDRRVNSSIDAFDIVRKPQPAAGDPR